MTTAPRMATAPAIVPGWRVRVRSLQRAVTAHLSIAEHAALCARAAREGLSPSAYACKVLRGHLRGAEVVQAANLPLDRGEPALAR
jgi:hypothetical protein